MILDKKPLDEVITEANIKSKQTDKKKPTSNNEDDEKILIKDFPRNEKEER